jgi:FkbH-like protein
MLEILEYPFDVSKILRKKKFLKRYFLEKEGLINIKIAVLGATTTFEVIEQLELFLLKSGFKPIFYSCNYGQHYNVVIFNDEALYNFKPDIVYLHISPENIDELIKTNKSSKEKAKIELNKMQRVWQKLNASFNCYVIQDNFEMPVVRSFGNFSLNVNTSSSMTITMLNQMIAEESAKLSYLNIIDRHYLSAKMGLDSWKDYSLWLSSKYSLSYNAITYLSYTVSKIINSLLGKSKKCLVLDLDNTLWGGVIGDVGKEGIDLGMDTSIGQAYLDFHLYIKELKDRGVILAVCSKNEFETAKSGFDHPDSILKFEDFTSFKANWDPKSKNIYEIADEINIGLESLVFIDDNPVERDIVRKEFGSIITVPEIGDDVVRYRKILDSADLFTVTSLSSEDVKRNEYYKDNQKREKFLSTFKNYDEYLKSLKMKAEIAPYKNIYLSRIFQLTNKTNQFNLTTRRMSLQEIEKSMQEKNKISFYARLIDKFGDNGLVSLIQGTIYGSEVEIDLWLMSCRVFKRTLEHSLLYSFLKEAKERDIKTVRGIYVPTKKNYIVSNLYKEMGFLLVGEKEGSQIFEIDLEKYSIPNNPNIIIEEL